MEKLRNIFQGFKLASGKLPFYSKSMILFHKIKSGLMSIDTVEYAA